MTTKTFTTKDSKGLEFICEAFYNSYYAVVDGHCIKVREDLYRSMGLEAKTLKELKNKISQI